MNGHLALRCKDGLKKFCQICAHIVPGKEVLLKRHLKGQHDLTNGQFLRYDEQPIECKWVNWQEYLANPRLKLIVKDKLKINTGGWSRKDKKGPINAFIDSDSQIPVIGLESP